MGKQIRRLTALQLYNFCGFNEFRFGKDRKKKNRYLLMGVLWVFLILMLLMYVAGMDIVCLVMGMPNLILLLSATVVCLVILFFSIFKAGSIIFQMKDYEMLMALPVSKQAVIISRFLTMYVNNLVFSILVMLPGIVIYGAGEKPGILFYLFMILGTLLLPLLPITIATFIGAGVTAISARMKHKSLVSGALSIVFAIAVILFSVGLQTFDVEMNEQAVLNMVENMSMQIGNIYPPAQWFTNAVAKPDFLSLLLFAGVSVTVFFVMVVIVSHYFTGICNALRARESGKRADISKLKENSVIRALYQKEWKRFLASGVYVSNAAIGDILMIVLAVALCIVGVEKAESIMQLPGLVTRLYPYALCFMMAIMPTTSCAISMEGQQWWLTRSLPVRTGDIVNSKILVNLTLAFPCYVIAEIFSCMAIKTNLAGYLILIFVPLVYMIFVSVTGLTMNLLFPVFDWENEAKAVKQSGATMLAMLVNVVCLIVPFILAFVVNQESQILVSAIFMIIWLVIAGVLYQFNIRTDLRKIG